MAHIQKEQIKKIRKMGIGGIAIEVMRPVASPFDLKGSDRKQIKQAAREQEVGIVMI